MARRRFFVGEVRNGRAELTGVDAYHLTRVLRVEPGQRYELSDDHRVYLAEIETARKDQVLFRILEEIPERPLPVRIALFPALTKFDRFEWMLEKATELGVESIVPFESERSERGLERAARKRMDRWKRILLESSQQCRRDHLPPIVAPVSFETVLNSSADYRFVLDEQPGRPALLSAVPAVRKSNDLAGVLIGPEGGWTDEERNAFESAGWTPVGLGSVILRAETAAIAALAILSAAWQKITDSQ